MSSRKIDKAKYGPGLGEVVLGAALSLVLGAGLAAAYLVAQPVQIVKEPPKSPPAGAIYYIEGGRNADRGKQWLRKKQLFTEGSSVELNENELNAWISAGTAAPAPAPGQKSAPVAPPSPASGMLQMDVPNFRIRDGVLQIGAKGTLNLELFGIKRPLIVQASGKFVKGGDGFIFEPSRFYVGSLPLHRLPGVGEIVLNRVLAKAQVPEDIAVAWKKLADVTIVGNTLKLSLP
ncbi:MAG: hypothetical protein PHE83_14770 [Opitutaceae bacterium]|nr:hypothetical protein [Opitutaceae bacterium]